MSLYLQDAVFYLGAVSLFVTLIYGQMKAISFLFGKQAKALRNAKKEVARLQKSEELIKDRHLTQLKEKDDKIMEANRVAVESAAYNLDSGKLGEVLSEIEVEADRQEVEADRQEGETGRSEIIARHIRQVEDRLRTLVDYLNIHNQAILKEMDTRRQCDVERFRMVRSDLAAISDMQEQIGSLVRTSLSKPEHPVLAGGKTETDHDLQRLAKAVEDIKGELATRELVKMVPCLTGAVSPKVRTVDVSNTIKEMDGIRVCNECGTWVSDAHQEPCDKTKAQQTQEANGQRLADTEADAHANVHAEAHTKQERNLPFRERGEYS